ncbi:MAG: hypothetical protein UZ21_OP11001000277 [Microgenomates bacterium OLB22]|nr:MAG: hypothetical protein UZ21_OP11001000277 [Microgenomates bacterium OLB22]
MKSLIVQTHLYHQTYVNKLAQMYSTQSDVCIGAIEESFSLDSSRLCDHAKIRPLEGVFSSSCAFGSGEKTGILERNAKFHINPFSP